MNYKGYTIVGKRTIEVFHDLADDGSIDQEIERYGEGGDFIEGYGFGDSEDDQLNFQLFSTLEECKQAIDADWTIEIHGKDGNVVTIPIKGEL